LGILSIQIKILEFFVPSEFEGIFEHFIYRGTLFHGAISDKTIETTYALDQITARR